MDVDFLDFLDFSERGLHVGDLVLRLGVAMILGGAIGIERERRERAAGFRTHAVVSVASALMMIVSAYGFPEEFGPVLDPSRIAAQVVSGIGFLGAGVIIFRKNTVRGLTTAASIWAVSGIGLAVGGGLYVAGTAGALFLLLIQAGLRPIEQKMFAHHTRRHRILLYVDRSSVVFKHIQEIASTAPGFKLLSLDFDTDEDDHTDVVELSMEVHKPDDILPIIGRFQAIPGLSHLDWHEGAARLSRRNRQGVDFPEEDEDDSFAQ